MPSQDLKTKHADVVETYKKNIESFDFFQKHVRNFFESSSLVPFVHSIRHRLKDIDHLLEKIERKNAEDAELEAAI